MYPSESIPPNRSDEITPGALLRRYAKNWPWFVVSVSLMLAGVYVYLARQQPIYRIQASILVQDEQRGSEQTNALKEIGVFAPKKVVENETEILRSFTLMDRVADKLNLDVRYFVPKTFGEREIYDESPVTILVDEARPALYQTPLSIVMVNARRLRIDGREYPLNKPVETPYGRLTIRPRPQSANTKTTLTVHVAKRSATVKRYLANLTASATGKNATVIQLSLEDAFPTRGEAVLNRLIDEYNYAAMLEKNKVAASTLNFIKDRLALVSGELASVERNVERYKSDKGITDLSTQSQTFLQTVQQNDALLNQVNIQLEALNDLQNYLKNQSDNEGTAPATIGLNDPTLLNLITELTRMEQQRDKLARTSSEQNPALVILNSQIKKTKRDMVENVATMKKMLRSSQQEYVSTNRKLEAEIRKIPQKERLLTDVSRQQAIKNDLYTYLLNKREETAVSFASAVPDSRTVDTARSSDAPVKPVKSTLYVLFGLLGFLIPVGIIGGRQALSTHVTRRADVEGATSVPILAELVRKDKSGPFVMTADSNTVIAEQIRTIRAELPYLRKGGATGQVLLFTSSISGEGKSFVSLNVGISLAIANHQTVILDLDMRVPKLHQAFGLDNSVGMSNYLTGMATLNEVLQPVPGYTNYFIMSSGPLPSNPTELLGSPRMAQLIDALRQRFAYILVDTPPVGLVSDARVVAPLIDATFFLVRHNVTPKNQLRMLDRLYHEQRFQNLNIILNAVDGSDAYHYNSQYQSSYPYSQGGTS